MATFGEIAYAVLDILKERSDDAFFTEEHVIFIASNMRSLLLERKYKGSRNGVFLPMPQENEQEMCIDVLPAALLPEGCAGMWLRSVDEIPDTMDALPPTVYPVNELMHTMVTFIPQERMPYVGYNKWLKNIIYASKSNDGHLYLTGSNPQFMNLRKLKMSAVFSDPVDAAKLACKEDGMANCDLLSQKFPLEAALVPSCIEMTVSELLGTRYAPEDKTNNAKDDLSEAAVVSQKQQAPAESSEPKK